MKRMPSSPYVIWLGDAERAELESVSRRPSAPFRLVLRSRIVLLAAAGTANRVIAERLGICQDTARKWRHRYCEQGIAGLADAPRPGRPRVFPARVVMPPARTSLISGDHRTIDPVQLGPVFCRHSIASSSRGGRAASFDTEELASGAIAWPGGRRSDVVNAGSQARDDTCRTLIAASERGQMHAAGAIPVTHGTCRQRRNTVPAWKKSVAGLVFA
jgi:Winged helix-turn helix